MLSRDLDICYDRRRDNLHRLAEALKDLHAQLRGAPDGLPFVLDARTLETGDSLTFRTTLGPLDILGTPGGTGGYDDRVGRATMIELGGHEVPVASVDDLIGMKEHAGREKERALLPHLLALKRELEADVRAPSRPPPRPAGDRPAAPQAQADSADSDAPPGRFVRVRAGAGPAIP